jgi:hypothetical protein
MPNFILTRASVIMCPHSGMVMHVPMSFGGELIGGQLPLLLSDLYFVAGCPFSSPAGPSPCSRVIWTNASVTRLIGGIPVLTNASIGLAQSASGVAQGGVVTVASFQTVETD